MKNIHVKVLKRLLMYIFPSIELDFFRPYISTIYKYIKNNGLVHTIKIYKQMRLHCTRYICGQPLLTNNMSIGLTKDGWPKKLIFLKKYVDKRDLIDLKFVFTILNFSRSWILNSREWKSIKPNYESITAPQKGKYIIPSSFLNIFVKDFSLSETTPSFTKLDLYLSSKAGPDGPATLSAYNSLLTYNYYEMDKILKITDEEGGNFFCQSYKWAWENNILPEKCKFNGKLSFIKDPEAKLRIVAISDYFTQLYLKPIHNIILRILRTNFKIKLCDRTFTQDPNHNWQDNEHKFWSLDLSSATDRFPISLQRRLLVRIFKNEIFADSWSYLLSNRKFISPSGDVLQYAVGQPMGTYSSWAVFTLTHHLLVHYCAFLNGITNFDQYILLGDDIVIKNDLVAQTYINILSKLGVEVSLNKTHVSKDTYEFAKRWIIWNPKGKKEITGIPLKGIISNFRNPYIVYIIRYDFFKIKGNQWSFNFSLVELLHMLYNKFIISNDNKSSKKKNSNKKISNKRFYH